MGCGLSKKEGAVADVISLCRERKRLMKMAVQQRQEFAEAHLKYMQSLSSVSSAISLFVSRYSSPPSAFLITQPSSPTTQINLPSNNHEPINALHQPSDSTITLDSFEPEKEKEDEDGGEEEEEDGGEVCEFFYGDNSPAAVPPMPSLERGNGWDFFNFFESDSIETVKLVREREGIPELEEDTETEKGECVLEEEIGDVGNDKNGVENGGQVKGMKMIEKEKDEKELLVALKEVEDNFLRAYKSGFDLARMLEVDKFHQQSGLEENKVTDTVNSSNAMNSIWWRQSISTHSSPCKSMLSYSSKTSSTWTECRSEQLVDCWGTQAGSHSFTLGRLYAWEKKLFEEVKAGDKRRKCYQQKCEQLRKKDVGGDSSRHSKARDEVIYLYNRILVSRRRAESISKQIQKLRDEELHPQLVELLHGLMRTWKIMLESHVIQAKTMHEVKSFTPPAYGKFSNSSHQVATLELEAELQSWNTSFLEYMASQKAYIKSIKGWLSNLMETEPHFHQKGGPSTPQFQMGTPTLLIACQSWLASLDRLPDMAVKCAMKSLVKDVRVMWVQQGEEQHQKRKVDGLTKELDRRVQELQKEEDGVVATKKMSPKNVRNRVEYLSGKKDSIDQTRRRVGLEKLKHQNSMEETKRVTLNGLGMGFSSVFESLIDFSRASVKMYADLVTYCENSSGGDE